MAPVQCTLVLLLVLVASAQHSTTGTTDSLADGRLVASPSEVVGTIAQLKLVAGFASNASLTPPDKGFKYVTCAVSYGTWVLQIQSETDRALSKALAARRKVRAAVDNVKTAADALLDSLDAENGLTEQQRRNAVRRHRDDIIEGIRKAVGASAEASTKLKPPVLMFEEMEVGLASERSLTKAEEYCRPNVDARNYHTTHKGRAIALLKQAKQRWNDVLELHRFMENLMAVDVGQVERNALDRHIDGLMANRRMSVMEFQIGFTHIAQRLLQLMSIVTTIEDVITSQKIQQRYSKLPTMYARRNDTEICRLYNVYAQEMTTYKNQAIDMMQRSPWQQGY